MDEAEAFTVLGLDPGATTAEIEAALREKAKFVHPDSHPGRDDAPYVELMQRLTVAREVALTATTSGTHPPESDPAPRSASTWRGLGRLVGFWRSKD